MTLRNQALQAQSCLISAIYNGNNSCNDSVNFESQGLAAYQRSLAANAKRALAISYPTIAQLVGDGFSALSREFLQHHPLTGGDWGEWGGELPAWLANKAELADYPYLSDCAQLDWLCHHSERAANVALDLDSLALLADGDAYQFNVVLASGTFLLDSQHPVVDIWNAHQASNQNNEQAGELFKLAAQSIAEQQAQTALVWRPQWKAQVQAIDATEFLWLQQLLAGQPLGSALDKVSHTDFNFESWLPAALQKGLFCGIALRNL